MQCICKAAKIIFATALFHSQVCINVKNKCVCVCVKYRPFFHSVRVTKDRRVSSFAED